MSANITAAPAFEYGHPTTYVFETEFRIYEIDAQSEKGEIFRNILGGAEKIRFLVENGTSTMKETGGRIMRADKGAWRFFNAGQLEYLFMANGGEGADFDTALERRYKELEQSEEKELFFYQNCTKIREWPERINRTSSVL